MQISKVLLVDEDENTRVVAEFGLRSLTNWEVQIAKTGAEALVKAAYLVPDLILIASNMTQMDGTQTLEQLRKNAIMKDVPVIFMNEKSKGPDAKKLMSLGARAVLTKPFDPQTFSNQILSVLKDGNSR